MTDEKKKRNIDAIEEYKLEKKRKKKQENK